MMGKRQEGWPPRILKNFVTFLRYWTAAGGPDDMNIPGFRLHPLKGTLSGNWAVSVSGNWRVTFRFGNGHAVDVDYIDYH